MDDIEIYKNIAQKIKYYREKQKITQEKLAEKSGLSLDYIGKIEVCINKPGLKSIIKIARALDVEIYKFFIADKK